MRVHLRAALLASLPFVHLALAGVARGTTVDDICGAPGSGKPCVCTTTPNRCRVTGVAPIGTGSVLDVGGRALELGPGARLDGRASPPPRPTTRAIA